jgi:hypothetical protein
MNSLETSQVAPFGLLGAAVSILNIWRAMGLKANVVGRAALNI